MGLWRNRWATVQKWLVVGMALIGLAGCNPSQLRTQAAQVPRLVVTSTSDPKTFNYITSDESSSGEILALMYEGLLTTNGITGELEPGLAESWEISDDQRRITYKLRDGLKWSDGEPMTVDDLIFTYSDIIFNEKIPTSVADIFRVGEQGLFPTVRKVDDQRVEFAAPEPFAPLLRFAGGAFLPRHALEKSIQTLDEQGNPQFLSTWGTDVNPKELIASGPYRLKSYQPGERAILERNPYYWRRDAEDNAQPYVEQFVFQFVASDDAALAQFRAGGIDVEGITPDYFALIKREEQRGDFQIYNGGAALSSQYISFNLNQARRDGKPLVDPIKSRWFNNLAFRQAVAHALDRPTMINNIYKGLGVPQHSAIYIQSPYYFPPEKGLPTYEYDLAEAKALLLSGGFKYSGDKLTDAEGNPVRFTLITNAGNKIREAMGTQIKQDLAAIGIQVDFQPIAFNTLVGKMSDSLDWEAILLGFSGAGVEPDGGRNIWSPTGRLHMFNQSPSPGQPPLEGWQVSDWETELGRLYVQGGQELDDSKRKAIYAEAQVLAQQHIPLIFLINPLALSAVKNRIQGVQYGALGGALWNVHELQLAQE
ncbi:MAG: ABC transporter substrate-binding protein [Pegethrix bostrychoides GSE-TBD4-15B]|jgi:peptide/nickel transport system substrate-binding protein|uniref:ABC transporter substrate-binding protein n=1 Tax=Pegethrix bostrychoides GSE-TBD4-15B TaxID=2839662 RepID=A0A951P9C7_9CYAN|nr:ABC transporter substrate-binding protein [Pegethrix bostrychoides GSE-TBD4-15B]